MAFMRDEFKNHKMVRFTYGRNNQQNFAMGMGKCRAVLENIDEIRAFVDGDDPIGEPVEIEKRKPSKTKKRKTKKSKTVSRFQSIRFRLAGILIGG